MHNATRLLLPCLLGALCSAPALAGLAPPAGYYAKVETKAEGGKAKAASAQLEGVQTCPTAPKPYTAKLEFRSKYEGSDKARATLNPVSEKAFRDATQDITQLERGVSKMVTQYMRQGDPQQLDCALQWMNDWAAANALLSTEFNHTGMSMRKWALGTLSSSYLRLKFSESRPLEAHRQQAEAVEVWFGKLADQVVQDWGDLPLKKVNNHSYWAAWSVMATSIALDRRDLFDWSVQQFRTAAAQVDAEGYLPNELKRRQRALAYHNYALPPLVMIAAFAQSNGVDLREENHQALKRLAERVIEGVEDQDDFDKKAGKDQDMEDLKIKNKYAWLEPYCALYACNEDFRERKRSMEPFNSFRLGGAVTQVFAPQEQKKGG
ncbi:mannuronate-specific alginate lyase [Pseudomonas sp. RIT-PI-AD]|uniref:mannuronate-specific alginate lyase n=1 Tax=Pseudomonas sp. RIT-PI-AD TaxID=3035294 RepID=UPI0021D8339E|nr:mannuronate-specific alginate lyase [Pseudomonas sp. RIT-PI-AD]